MLRVQWGKGEYMMLPSVLNGLSVIGEIRHTGWEKIAAQRQTGSVNLYILKLKCIYSQ